MEKKDDRMDESKEEDYLVDMHRELVMLLAFKTNKNLQGCLLSQTDDE